jgi:hypothetical protein
MGAVVRIGLYILQEQTAAHKKRKDGTRRCFVVTGGHTFWLRCLPKLLITLRVECG